MRLGRSRAIRVVRLVTVGCVVAGAAALLAATSPSHAPTAGGPARARLEDHPLEAQVQDVLQLENEHHRIPAGARVAAAAHVRSMRSTGRSAPISRNAWTFLGPGNIGGRIRAIAISPTSATTMWIGGAAGGVWKTTDGGASWQALDDFMANLAVTSIVVDPANANVLYAGTGEGFGNGDAVQGDGVFKSTDGGTTWSQLAATNNSSWFYVNRLAISPSDSQVLLAATQSGIWRTADGGTTWTQATSGTFYDVAFDPGDPTQAIASTGWGEAWYSTNGGAGWSQSTGIPTILSNRNARVEVAYAPSSPSTVYASVAENAGTVNASTNGEIWRSTDGGHTYTKRSTTETGYLATQGWYGNSIWVDPTNASTLVVGGVDLWRSTDGGQTLTRISQWQNAPAQSAHADQHAIVAALGFDGVTNKTVFFGDDGGIFKAANVYSVSTLSGWQALNNNLGITQFFSASPAPGGTVFGGAQDNGTIRSNGNPQGWSTPPIDWGGDGGITDSSGSYLYGEYVYADVHRSTDGGSTADYISGQYWNGTSWVWKSDPYRIPDAQSDAANFIAPLELDPNDDDRLLVGGASLWRTSDAKTANTASTGPTWTSIKPTIGVTCLASSSLQGCISAIAIAPGNSDVIWVGYDNGQIYKTTNGTATTPTWTRVDNTAGTPARYVLNLAIDPLNANVVYALFGGFSSDDVWRTTDGGTTWSTRVGSGATGLPFVPARTLAFHPTSSDQIYLGTEAGVFNSDDGGATWYTPEEGPANTRIDKLFWLSGTTLVTASHGRGVWSANAGTVTPPGSVVFMRYDGTDYELWSRADNGTETQLTNNAVGDWDPSVSPDGNKIAFSRNPNGDGNYFIYVMNSDGSGVTQLTTHTGTAVDEYPTWSADGTKIAFDTNRDGNFEIYSVNANGAGSTTRLTTNAAQDTRPEWSPDGAKIAFQTTRNDANPAGCSPCNWDVYTMSTTGTNLVQVTTSTAADEFAAWSPTGTKLAFESDRSDSNFEIFSAASDGTGTATRLTNSPANDLYPTWAADGTRVVFETNRFGDYDLLETNADGTGTKKLEIGPQDELEPAWKPMPTATAPGAPTGVTATGGNASASVSWTAPASDGGSAITHYVVTPYIGATAQTPTTVGAVISTTIGGLANGTTYTFKVAAQNAIGQGPDSAASNAVTPAASVKHASLDFDGDGKTDVAVFRPSEGRWYMRRSSDSGLTITPFGLSTDIPVPADYDGDGKADIAIYRPSEGRWYILLSSNSSLQLVNFGTSTDVPVPGDYDGDGKADLAVFRPSEGRWYIRRSSDTSLTLVDFGLSSDLLVPADYDGDGKADVAVFRPSEGRWYIKRSSDSGLTLTTFGLSSDLPVPGDYDGDGKADTAVFRPSEGRWYDVRSSDSGLTLANWGTSSDRVEPADYDGDGKVDTTVFRPSEGRWYVHRSSDSSLQMVDFGLSTDVQLTLPYALRKVFYP